MLWFVERHSGLLRLQDLVRAPPTSKMEVHIRQGTVNTYRQVLREIKQRDINNIIVDTRTEHVHIFFRAVSGKWKEKNNSTCATRQHVLIYFPVASIDLLQLFVVVVVVSLDRLAKQKEVERPSNIIIRTKRQIFQHNKCTWKRVSAP